MQVWPQASDDLFLLDHGSDPGLTRSILLLQAQSGPQHRRPLLAAGRLHRPLRPRLSSRSRHRPDRNDLRAVPCQREGLRNRPHRPHVFGGVPSVQHHLHLHRGRVRDVHAVLDLRDVLPGGRGLFETVRPGDQGEDSRGDPVYLDEQAVRGHGAESE